MRLGMGCFGIVVALMVAIPASTAIYSTFHRVAQEVAHPLGKYQLTFEIDGQYYIADHDLTLEDCYQALDSTKHDPSSFRNGEGRYSCDLQPKES